MFRFILFYCTVLSQFTDVTDRQTDGNDMYILYVALKCGVLHFGDNSFTNAASYALDEYRTLANRKSYSSNRLVPSAGAYSYTGSAGIAFETRRIRPSLSRRTPHMSRFSAPAELFAMLRIAPYASSVQFIKDDIDLSAMNVSL